MKAIARFLTLITALVLLAGGYILWASDARVEPAGATVVSAADHVDVFSRRLEDMRTGASGMAVYSTDVQAGNPERYVFVTYTLRARNLDLLAMEWLQLEMANQPGDVLLMLPTVEDIPALNERLITVELLTERNAATLNRVVTLGYYIYGHPRMMTLELRAD